MKAVSVIIVAAGSGTRMSTNLPKQFLKLDDHTVLYHSVSRFINLPSVCEIILVVHPDFVGSQYITDSIPQTNIRINIVSGAKQRYESVLNGLNAVSSDARIVCIHDGVRPFIKEELILKSIALCENYDGAIVATRETDTLKSVSKDIITGTVDRHGIWRAQTPQTFRKTVIQKAYSHAMASHLEATDDAALVESIGGKIAIVEGSPWNFKITEPDDLQIAKVLLEKETHEAL